MLILTFDVVLEVGINHGRKAAQSRNHPGADIEICTRWLALIEPELEYLPDATVDLQEYYWDRD